MNLLCVLCYTHPQMPEAESTAFFVINGLSVCKAHVDVAKDASNFHAARTKIMQQYLKDLRQPA